MVDQLQDPGLTLSVGREAAESIPPHLLSSISSESNTTFPTEGFVSPPTSKAEQLIERLPDHLNGPQVGGFQYLDRIGTIGMKKWLSTLPIALAAARIYYIGKQHLPKDLDSKIIYDTTKRLVQKSGEQLVNGPRDLATFIKTIYQGALQAKDYTIISLKVGVVLFVAYKASQLVWALSKIFPRAKKTTSEKLSSSKANYHLI